MKHLLFLLLLCPIIVQAQFSKGDATFGGAANLVYFSQGGLRNDGLIGIAEPSYGLFLSDNLLVGSIISAQARNNIFDGFTSLTLRPFARYYLAPERQNDFFYGELRGTLRNIFLSSNGFSSEITAALGLDHFVAPGVAAEVSAELSHGFSLSTTSVALRARLRAFLQNKDNTTETAAVNSIRQGALMIGGSEIDLVRGLNYDSWSFRMNPSIGYFLNNRWALQADVALSVGRSSGFGIPRGFVSNDFFVSPSVRYYWLPKRRLAPFFFAAFEYQRTANGQPGLIRAFTASSGLAGIGANLFLTQQLALEGSFFYTRNFTSEINLLRLSGGVQYFIP